MVPTSNHGRQRGRGAPANGHASEPVAGPPTAVAEGVELAGNLAVLRAIVDSTADGVLVVDNDGQTIMSNRRFAELWRIPPDLIETRSDDQLLAFVLDQLEDPDAFLAKVQELYGSDLESLHVLRF